MTEVCQKKHCTDGLVDPQDCSGELFLSFANVVLLYSGQPLQYLAVRGITLQLTHAFMAASSGALVLDQQVILSDSVCARAGRDYSWHIRIWYDLFGARVVESPPVSVQGGGVRNVQCTLFIAWSGGGQSTM